MSVFGVCAGQLIETASAQIVGDDDVGDGVEDELDVGRVGGARHVAVDLLGRRLIFGLELCLDISGRLAVLLCAWSRRRRRIRRKRRMRGNKHNTTMATPVTSN